MMPPVLIVAGDFVKTGGMDRANYALAEYLAAQGRQVRLVSHWVAPALLQYPTVRQIQVPKLLQSYALSAPLLDWVGRWQGWAVERAGGWVLVNGGNCQWVGINWVHYVHGAFSPFGQGASASAGWQHWKMALTHKLNMWGEKQAFRQAQLIIANSEQTRQALLNLGVAATQIQRIYYGIDPSCFYAPTLGERRQLRRDLGWTQPTILFVGGVGDRRKGLDTALAAWEYLCTHYPAWSAQLVVVGRGAALPFWQHWAEQSTGGDRIQFLGFRTDVPDLMRAADCLLAPTRYEPYGLAVHEALCCGLPALVTAQAGVAERYPEALRPLLLSEPNNAEAVAVQLWHWWQQRSHYAEQVAILAEHLRRYTWTDMARDLLAQVEAHEPSTQIGSAE
jgi:glycosyltransferase involved in cell wall biosynthesis